MKKKIFIVAIICFFIGLTLIAIGVALGGSNYLKQTNIDSLSGIINFTNNTYSNQTKELQKFSNMDLSFNYSNFSIKKSDNDKYYIEYSNKENHDYNIRVENDTLIVNEDAKLTNHSFINLDGLKNMILNTGFNKQHDFTLYVPESNFNNITISNEMGVIKIYNIIGNKFTIKNSMGLIDINNCEANIYDIDQSMGKVHFSGIIAHTRLKANTEMGEIDGRLIYDKKTYYKTEFSSEMGSLHIDPIFKNSDRKNEKEVNLILKTEMGKISLKSEN